MALFFHPFARTVLWIAPATLALALAGCSPATNSASTNDAQSSGASANSSVGNATTTNGAAANDAANSTVISATPSAQTPPRAALASVWVPGKDGKLHLKPVSKAATDVQKKFKDPTEAINDLIRQSPGYFPPKTRALDWHFDGKAVSLNFNRAFVDTNFWSKRGEGRTQLAVYAIVNSAAVSAGGAHPVVLEVEKAPVQTLGEMDAGDAIEPNPRLQSASADAGSATTGNNSGVTGDNSGAMGDNSGAAGADAGAAGRGEP